MGLGSVAATEVTMVMGAGSVIKVSTTRVLAPAVRCVTGRVLTTAPGEGRGTVWSVGWGTPGVKKEQSAKVSCSEYGILWKICQNLLKTLPHHCQMTAITHHSKKKN